MSLVNHVGLTVSDIDSSVAFYAGVVGMTVQTRTSSGGPWFDTLTGNDGAVIDVVMLRATDVVLQLVQYLQGGNSEAMTGHSRVGNVHLCINVDDVEATRAAVVAAGLPATPIVALPVPGMRSFYTSDPDGVPVELLQGQQG
jgi:catechol 2,3-dioxygenase-like lactoylglutathione lyase family enzyme